MPSCSTRKKVNYTQFSNSSDYDPLQLKAEAVAGKVKLKNVKLENVEF